MNSIRAGNCEHTFVADKDGVWLANDNDSFFKQQFENREELDGFINQAIAVRDKAFPEKKS